MPRNFSYRSFLITAPLLASLLLTLGGCIPAVSPPLFTTAKSLSEIGGFNEFKLYKSLQDSPAPGLSLSSMEQYGQTWRIWKGPYKLSSGGKDYDCELTLSGTDGRVSNIDVKINGLSAADSQRLLTQSKDWLRREYDASFLSKHLTENDDKGLGNSLLLRDDTFHELVIHAQSNMLHVVVRVTEQ